MAAAAEDRAAYRPDSPAAVNEGVANRVTSYHLPDYPLDLLPVACPPCSGRAGVAVDMTQSNTRYPGFDR